MLFLGQNDLCMSMGLYEKYEFPLMYASPELGAATDKLAAAARKNNVPFGRVSLWHIARPGIPRQRVITALETMGWKRRN